MRDIIIGSYGETNFKIVEDAEALRSQHGLFLITDTGSLDYDEEYGLDYKKILYNHEIDNTFKENYIKGKLNSYFASYYSKPPLVIVDKKNRELTFKVIYFSIYGGEETVTI